MDQGSLTLERGPVTPSKATFNNCPTNQWLFVFPSIANIVSKRSCKSAPLGWSLEKIPSEPQIGFATYSMLSLYIYHLSDTFYWL